MSVHDRWGKGARSGPGLRWEVRWRQAGAQRKRRFSTETAARTFDAKRLLDPRIADLKPALTVREMVESYLAGIGGLRPKTQDAYHYDAAQVLDRWGDVLAARVRPSEVRTWVARPDASAIVRHRSLMMLRRCYKLALQDRVLTENPTDGVALPKVTRSTMKFLTWSELERLADAAGEHRPLILLLGSTGLRLGEALGLEQQDIDRERKRIRVRRSWSVSSVGRELGPTKGAKEREVPVQGWLLKLLPTEPGPLFIGAKGGRLDPHWWRSAVFKPAAVAAGLGAMHPHELRHTAASLAIASNADAGVVQRMLGHASAAMTMDRYRGLFDSSLDDVAAAMEQAREVSLVAGSAGRTKGA